MEGLRQTALTFGEVEHVSAKDLIHKNWERDAAALIIPGGADIPYMKRLRGQGNLKIRVYVENGGVYIGICAGAYYAGERVEFALNTSQEVNQERELQFFPGIVRGPILAPFDPASLRDLL